MKYTVKKCLCGSPVCTDFFVSSIAGEMDTSFTLEQATAVAALLGRMEPSLDRETFSVPDGYTAERINDRTTGWLIQHGSGKLIHYSEIE